MIFDINSLIPGTRSFSWNDALWLPKWQIHAIPTPSQEKEIIKHAYKLQQLQDRFGLQFKTNSWLRPPKYNEFVGGSKNSFHTKGSAWDGTIYTLDCDDARVRLEPLLEEYKLRMERREGSDWIHLDSGEVIKSRYFYP
jgi:mannosyltransferase OCH1-like enzyme